VVTQTLPRQGSRAAQRWPVTPASTGIDEASETGSLSSLDSSESPAGRLLAHAFSAKSLAQLIRFRFVDRSAMTSPAGRPTEVNGAAFPLPAGVRRDRGVRQCAAGDGE